MFIYNISSIMFISNKNRSRKRIHDVFDYTDGGFINDYGYVRNFNEVIELSKKHNISIDEAVESLVVTLHETRRLIHSVSWKFIKYCLIENLQKFSFLESNCNIMLDDDHDKTPIVHIQCPKHNDNKQCKCNFNKIKITNIISSFESLANQAKKINFTKYQKEFNIISDQLRSVRISAIHQKYPNRVTMCPSGNCHYGNGFFLPFEVEVKVPKCGKVGCNDCGFNFIKKPVRTTTCPAGCTIDDPNGLKIDDDIIQIPLRWCVECGGNHNDNDVCDHKSLWKRLPDIQKKLLERKVLNGKAQHCPKCFLIQEKHSGCDKMTCPDCDTKFCLKCGEILDCRNYVTEHLFTIEINNSYEMICRKTVIEKALKGEKYMNEVLSAYKNGTKKVIEDVNNYFKSPDDISKIPKCFIDILPDELRRKYILNSLKDNNESQFTFAVRASLK